jgi:hypothetical protein
VKKACPICRRHAHFESQKFGDADIVRCPQCGNFKISGTAIAVLESVNDPERRREYLETAKRWVEPEDLPFIRNI